MLILRRNEGESIMIGSDIRITVTEHNAVGWVKLGIEAPREVPVHRQEVFEAIAKRRIADLAATQTNHPSERPKPPVQTTEGVRDEDD